MKPTWLEKVEEAEQLDALLMLGISLTWIAGLISGVVSLIVR